MSSDELQVAILTVSDRASSGVYEDQSGPALVEAVQRLLKGGIVETAVVPDDQERIVEQLRGWADKGSIDLILTTGGTGFAPRDVTPEATMKVIEKPAPGLTEAMRAASREITPYAMLSRSTAGIRGQTLIINLPGSPKAAVENLQIIAPVLPHAVALIRGESSKHAVHTPPRPTA